MKINTTFSPTSAQIEMIRNGLIEYNLAQVPALANLPHRDFAIVARDDNGHIIGGAVGEVEWGYVYIDSLWVDEAVRGRGIGRAIMQRVDAYRAALENPLPIYLFTTDFQAIDFYKMLGFRVFGTLADRPMGHHNYYLTKDVVTSAATSTIAGVAFDIEAPPPQSTQDVIVDGLLAHAAAAGHPVAVRDNKIAVLLADGARIVGGMYGGWLWGWLELHLAWVDSALRGQGYGTQLLQHLEDACRAKGLTGIVCDTTDFQALDFYRHHGFRVVGTLSDHPPEHTCYFLAKELTTDGTQS